MTRVRPGGSVQQQPPAAEVFLAPRSQPLGKLVFALLALAFAVFCALGVWQVQRMIWKHTLIAQVAQRVAATPVPAPSLAAWRAAQPAAEAYRRVTITGWLHDERIIPVQAVTQYGSGYWIISPLQRDDGSTILINRGFIAAPLGAALDLRATSRPSYPKSRVIITGLVRLSEPKGAFLRNNDPQAGRWYARDVPVMARSLGLVDVAPFFVDADAASSARLPPFDATGTIPLGGLTVIAFSDNHLVYAVTWFALALMVAGYAAWFARTGRRARPLDR